VPVVIKNSSQSIWPGQSLMGEASSIPAGQGLLPFEPLEKPPDISGISFHQALFPLLPSSL
jgi:hypothetical protein